MGPEFNFVKSFLTNRADCLATKLAGLWRRRQLTMSWEVAVGQRKISAILIVELRTWPAGNIAHTLNAVPLNDTPCLKYVLVRLFNMWKCKDEPYFILDFILEIICKSHWATQPQLFVSHTPALNPITVICFGSPPNAAIFSDTHLIARAWSLKPLFPGLALSAVLKNPVDHFIHKFKVILPIFPYFSSLSEPRWLRNSWYLHPN